MMIAKTGYKKTTSYATLCFAFRLVYFKFLTLKMSLIEPYHLWKSGIRKTFFFKMVGWDMTSFSDRITARFCEKVSLIFLLHFFSSLILMENEKKNNFIKSISGFLLKVKKILLRKSLVCHFRKRATGYLLRK